MARIAEQQRREEAIYRTVLPEIVETITKDVERIETAQRLSETHGIDSRTVYRWIQWVDDQTDRFRKRRAVALLVPIWLGIGVIGVIGIAAALGRIDITAPFPLIIAVVASLGIVAPAVRLRGLRERSLQMWAERETQNHREAE